MPIRRLPPLLVNQIAAGEVIERPASVVKELVENSIDAGATQIHITIEQGGCELIQVTDDGQGIPIEELPLAIAPHATSKIQSAEDLDAIATMGFRGEALASIASVSRMSITSRSRHAAEGAILQAEGEKSEPARPAGAPPGTTVTIRNLFFNTPARRKFLRSEQTEATRVGDTVETLALSHPSIGFELGADGRLKVRFPPGQSPRERTLAVLGAELEPELIEVNQDDRGTRLWGMVGKPSIARATARHQRIFLNGRAIVDRSISHAVKEAFRGLIEPARHPTIVLFLTIDPSEVDVNVHPTKAEVRFRSGNVVHGVVLSALREALRSADLTPGLAVPQRGGWTMSSDMSLAGLEGFGSGLEHGSKPAASSFVEYFRRLDPAQQGFVFSEVREALAADAPARLRSFDARAPEPERALPIVRHVADVLQVHSSYIVTQDETGLVIIDQHALHERVMFEKLKGRLSSGPLESQRLLMPAIAMVDPAHLALLDALRPLLDRLGIEAEPIGRSSVGVHAFTSLLFERGVEPAQFMTELIEKAARAGLNPDPEAALHEVLDMMACKAAVKAGDRLAPEELAELLSMRQCVERSSNCPHGRPTSLRLSLKELERQFGRT